MKIWKNRMFPAPEEKSNMKSFMLPLRKVRIFLADFFSKTQKKSKMNSMGRDPKDEGKTKRTQTRRTHRSASICLRQSAGFPAPKGISLPVNTIIILIIAVLVLGIIAVFLTSYSGKATASISHAAAWAEGCKNAKAQGCETDYFILSTDGIVVKGYDPDGDDTAECTNAQTPDFIKCGDDSLTNACNNFFGYSVDIITGGPSLAKLQEDCHKKCCG